jgi:hypothetical protein
MEELEKGAKHFNYIEFGRREFDKLSEINISSSCIRSHFGGSWSNALNSLRIQLQQKGLNLSPRPHGSTRVHSDKAMFEEMERIWKKVGQRPSLTEWELSEPKISYNCYRQRFGGWVNACTKFIEYKVGGNILAEDFVLSDKEEQKDHTNNNAEYKKENSRSISLTLRLKVLIRDNFRCVFCGKSPATDLDTKLHIDHIKPFSKGGKSILENLQTLCEKCNLGKSNKQLS